MNKEHQIDNLDKLILLALMKNARTPYAELAKKYQVSPATIHVRVEKMRQTGLIAGTYVAISPKHLGYDVTCFIGIILNRAKDYQFALKKLYEIDEIIEAYYTTGPYNIFTKIMTKSINDLQNILINKIQTIDEIRSTETLISLDNPIKRMLTP